MEGYTHEPVLLKEALEGLNIKSNGIYVDATLGGAGHSGEILKRLDKNGHLYAFDQDEMVYENAHNVLGQISSNYTIVDDNFVNIKDRLNELNINKVDGVLYDLGVSSFHFDIPERGFSYSKDAFLDMRMDQSQELTAHKVVNTYSYEDLVKIFYDYGEEQFSKSIARKIIKYREEKEIITTLELVDIINSSIPSSKRRAKAHPARKVFQAIRIEVNDELNVLRLSLKQSLELLNSQGRICVITFHSLEDRIVKEVFKSYTERNLPPKLPIIDEDIKLDYRLINRRVITPSEEEISRNNRARSAKLRIIEKL